MVFCRHIRMTIKGRKAKLRVCAISCPLNDYRRRDSPLRKAGSSLYCVENMTNADARDAMIKVILARSEKGAQA
jgi:hypothetical protein